MKTYEIENDRYLCINKDGRYIKIDLDAMFPEVYTLDEDVNVDDYQTKQTCSKTHKECGFINFTNDVCDLMKKHDIKGVNQLTQFLELREFELKSGLLETGSSILAFLQSPYIKSILDLYVDVRKLRGIGDENLD